MPDAIATALQFARDFLDTPIARVLGLLLVACFCGGIVGLERELRGKPAGLRTMMMICCGSTLFTIVSLWSVEGSVGRFGDSSRVIAQIVTGIGFLGAGTIIHGEGLVVGLTTASTIWTLAAIGCFVGLGYPIIAVAASFLIVTVLMAFERIEHGIQHKKKKRYRIAIVYSKPYREVLRDLTRVINSFKAVEFRLISLRQGGKALYHQEPDMNAPMEVECELSYPYGHFQVFLGALHQLRNVQGVEVSPIVDEASEIKSFERMLGE